MEPGVATGVALQIADALSAAHKQGVIHGDVKSQNILVTRRGDIKGTNDVKVTDVGIAWAASSSPTTVTGAVLSAAGYMPSEQAKGEPVGPASDLYSLGVVLYEMLTGGLPYTAEDLETLKTMHASEPSRSPREANPNVPKSLDDITQKLLAKSPEDRYANAEDLSEALERAYSGLSPIAAKRHRRGTILLVAGASLLFIALLVLLAGLSAWALIPESPKGQPKAAAQKAAAQKGWQPDAETKGLKKELEGEQRGERPVPGVGREGSPNNDVLQGTDDRDALSGGDGDDQLSGEDGDDKIEGGNGNDTLSGGPSADTFLGGNGVDEIDTGDDDVEDIVRCGDGFDTVTVGAEDTVLGCEDVTTR